MLFVLVLRNALFRNRSTHNRSLMVGWRAKRKGRKGEAVYYISTAVLQLLLRASVVTVTSVIENKQTYIIEQKEMRLRRTNAQPSALPFLSGGVFDVPRRAAQLNNPFTNGKSLPMEFLRQKRRTAGRW